jgi:FkbM family methyltransferase
MSLTNTLRFILNHPLNKRQPVRALLRFAAWQARSRLKPGPFEMTWVNGARMLVGRGESTLTGNLYCGLYEFEDMAFVLHILRPEDLFVDVGANLGSYTLLAGAGAGARVIAFEPAPGPYRRLVENIRLNRLEEKVTAHNVAAGDAEGELAFTTYLASGHHIVAEGEQPESSYTVHVAPLDAFIERQSPAVLKVDVEGYEMAVVRGASRTLASPGLHSIIMELKGRGNRYGFDEVALAEELRQAGFQPFRYDPFRRSLHALDSPVSASNNTLFIRNLEHVLARLASAPAFEVLGNKL